MNKSKFLKKSLAMVLAVMLVVAMIPLGASAAPGSIVVNDGAILTIATARGTLEGSGTSYTDTLTYDEAENETLTVAVDPSKGYDTVMAVVTDGEGEDAAEVKGLAITVPNGSKKVTFYAVKDGTETKSATYTVTMNQPAPSTDLSLKSAKLGNIEGVVNNSAKTITFKVPWGYNGSLDVTAEQNFPVTGVTPTATVTTIGESVTMSVTSQFGNTDTYTIITEQMECISGITVAGVAGVLDTEEDSETEGMYVVTLPEGTDLDEKVTVNYREVSNSGVKVASATWADEAFKNGSKVTVVAGENNLVLTSTADDTAPVTVKVYVVVEKSTDASITEFTGAAKIKVAEDELSAVEYAEKGTVNGKKLTVVLPYKSDLANVKLSFKVAAGAAVQTVNGVEFTAYDGTNFDAATSIDLSEGKEVLVDVLAADGTTHKYYELSATAADSPYGAPAISGSVLTIGADDEAEEYTGTISGNTINFLLPYATVADDVTDFAKYTWTKSFATNFVYWDPADDPFKDGIEVVIQSDAGDVVTYTLVFKKEAAKTGKTVSGVSMSTAATSDKVTADNTYNVTVSGTKATISLPHSFQKATETELHTTFTIPEGAALYFNDFAGTAANLNTTPVASGYNAEDAEADPKAPKNTITVEQLTAKTDDEFTTKIVVADETAKVLLAQAKADGSTVTLEELAEGDYKGHVTIYDIEPKFASPETGHALTALTADEGKVTSKVTGNTIEITVPYSYAKYEVPFYADYTASKLATVMAGETVLPTTAPDEEGATGSLKVVDTDGTLSIEVFNGTDYAAFDRITVENEAETASTPYTVTVKVAPAETGADITSLKVNNTVGNINRTAKTVSVVMTYGTDLTAVTLDYEVSKLAYHDLSIEGTPDPDDEDTILYDVSEPFTISVMAEDEKTVKVYTVTVTASQQFSDVKPGAYYYDDVYAAASAGIVNGKPNGTFGPTENVTRKDFALMVVRMLGVEDEAAKYTTTTFTDVAKDYAMGAIAYCAENGIINGDGKGHFNPGKPIARQEAALMIARALKLDMVTNSTDFTDDAQIASWAKAGVAACAKAGIIKGSNGKYMPKDNIRRADAAAILVRALNK